MKKITKHLKLLTTCMFAMNFTTFCQTFVGPTHPDKLLGTLSPAPNGLGTSSATIDFCNTKGGCSTPKKLTAFITFGYDASSSYITALYVTDGVHNITATAPASPISFLNSNSSTSVFLGDIVIGNDPTSATTFNIGILYNLYDASAGAQYEKLDIYKVTNPGTSSMAVTYNHTYAMPNSTSSNWEVGARIDMIEEADVTGPTGKPLCDKFGASWSDRNANALVAYEATLSAPLSGTLVPVSSFSDYYYYDIAGVQEADPITGLPDDILDFTYLDGSRQLYFQSYNFTTSTLSALTSLGSPSPSSYYVPRIDAVDNYHLNSSPINKWVVVAENGLASLGSGSNYIQAFTNLAPAGSPGFMLSAYNDFQAPTVALGPGNEYTVGYYGSYAYPQSFHTVIVPFSGSSFNPTGYLVNMSSIIGGWGIPNLVTLSGSCNTDGDYLFSGWQNYSSGTATAYYKLVNLPSGYKPAEINKPIMDDFIVYPNPANDHITIKNNYHTSNNEYDISDVSGRTLQRGQINSSEQTININNLTKGFYFLNIHSDKDNYKTKIVKE